MAISISHAWRALRHRNFRLFAAGQSISLIGNWMTRLATGWLVYRLTHSAFLLGIVGFAAALARLEAQVVFVELSQRFPHTQLVGNAFGRLPSFTFRGIGSLPVMLR